MYVCMYGDFGQCVPFGVRTLFQPLPLWMEPIADLSGRNKHLAGDIMSSTCLFLIPFTFSTGIYMLIISLWSS